MKITRYLACALMVLCSALVYGQVPQVQYWGDIAFISGGIGSEESDAIQVEAKKWPIMLEFSQVDAKGWGAWVSGVKLRVIDSQRQEVFATLSEGPFLLLGLKPGDYLIEAAYDGVVQKRAVNLKPGQSERLSIYWK